MSTKTTFKRVALVAVAALGFGLLSAIPSTAALQSGAGTVLYNYGPTDSPSKPAITISSDAATNTARLVLKDEFYSTVSGDVDTLSVSVVTNVRNADGALNPGYPAWQSWALTNRGTGAVSSDTSKATLTSTGVGVVSGEALLFFTPTYAGTYVFRITATSGWSYDWTVIAVAADTTLNVAKSTSVLIAGNAASPAVADTDDVVVAAKAASTTAGSQAAYAVVTAKNAAGTTLASQPALTVTVSGPGLVGIGTNRATLVPQGRAVTGGAANGLVGIFSDGTAGPATITISSGSTVISTETVVFYGDVASYSATVKKNVIPMGVNTGAVVAVVAKDKDGNVVPSQTVTVKASDSAVVADTTGTTASASEAAAGTATIGVTGIATKFGKLTLTISNAAATISTTAVVTLSSTTAKTVTLAFDKAEYSAGEKVTLKATAVDANGLPVASMDPITGLTANTSLMGFPTTWDSTTTDGAVSYSFYAPLVPGPISLAGTDSNAAAITASATVLSDGVAQAAADAAAEAIDAANAAAEAADAATAAAQDAADAVAALSVQVSEQIAELKAQNDALRKQLIALTNLIIKIQKKVKA
jgi:hypothetical protein